MKLSPLIFLFLAIIPLSYAQLVTTPNNVAFNTIIIGDKHNQTIAITNVNNFSIYNTTMDDLDGFKFGVIPQLGINESGNLQINASPDYTFTGTKQAKIRFLYKVTIPNEPKTYYVNITSVGFSPDQFEIMQGDTIIWSNIDSITHIISSSAFGADVEVTPGSTWSKVFNNIGRVNYQDNVVFFAGLFDVLNRTTEEYAHDANYDVSYPISFTSIYPPTTLNYTIVDGRDMSIDFGNTKEGLLFVGNLGNNTALNITFSADKNWVDFTENYFSLNPGESNYLTFRVTPVIYNTDESNKSYQINLKLSSDSTSVMSQNISVFIPYIDLMGNASSPEEFFRQKKIFCDAYPTSPFCVSEPVVEYVNRTIVKEPDLPYNFTQTEIATIFTRLQKVEDAQQKLGNIMNLWDTDLRNYMEEQKKISNDTNVISKKNQEDIENRSTVTWIISVGAVVLICIGTITYLYKVKRKNQAEKQLYFGREKS